MNFWKHVDKNGPIPAHCPELGPCWVWTAYRNKDGYGRCKINREWKYVHRLAWELEAGAKPENSVLHRCDNPACVRYSHLFAGTQADNMADMTNKGRRVSGRGGQRQKKLTDTQAEDMKTEYQTGETSVRKLGIKFGLHYTRVSRIIAGLAYN